MADTPQEYHADEQGDYQRRKHKYSTADMKASWPWKKCLTYLLIFIVVMAIMIGISMLMQKLFNPPEEEGPSNSTETGADGETPIGGLIDDSQPSKFPKNLQFLEDVCTAARLASEERSLCEDACVPSEGCCDPFGGDDSTCFEDNLAGCYTYSKCHSLDGFIDPAHKDLDRVCSQAGVEINREECERECSSMSCCYTDTESCLGTQFQACLDYAPCQNLREGAVNVAPFDLDLLCGKQSANCRRECREATCCSDSNSNCYRENFMSCLTYSSCTGNSDISVRVAPIYSRVVPPPDDFESVCLLAKVEETGPDACQEYCGQAACCFGNGADNCFGEDPLGCLQYRRCSILQLPEYGGEIIAAPDILTEKPTTVTPTEGNVTIEPTSTGDDLTIEPTATGDTLTIEPTSSGNLRTQNPSNETEAPSSPSQATTAAPTGTTAPTTAPTGTGVPTV